MLMLPLGPRLKHLEIILDLYFMSVTFIHLSMLETYRILSTVNLFNQDEDTKTIPDKTSIFSLIILERISFEV